MIYSPSARQCESGYDQLRDVIRAKMLGVARKINMSRMRYIENPRWGSLLQIVEDVQVLRSIRLQFHDVSQTSIFPGE